MAKRKTVADPLRALALEVKETVETQWTMYGRPVPKRKLAPIYASKLPTGMSAAKFVSYLSDGGFCIFMQSPVKQMEFAMPDLDSIGLTFADAVQLVEGEEKLRVDHTRERERNRKRRERGQSA